ncbi:histone-lysine N-methyltransferase 2C-like [Clytia hemisphaerica]|uniref:histone-lysine N-methyltransferase 2C-like n=1 Tax=Clytia hemisphaerica TaxID=252671 RepID=UPI0034D67DCA
MTKEMTEDSMGSGRPRKNTRKSNGNSSSCPCSTNGITDIPEAQVIVEPLSTAMSDIMNEESSDAATYSPAKAEESSEICALCNCGQEMALILGEITKYPVASSTLKKIKEKMKTEMDRNINSEVSSSDNQKNIKEKSFVKRRRRKKDNDFDLTLPPDMTTFGTANVQDFNDIIDSKGKNLFAHHCCAAWSAGVSQNDSCDLENVDKAVAKALTKKCSHCDRYGASVECQVHRCTKIYHYACCASTGAFQDINSMNLLCPDHLDRTEKLTNADPSCDACGKTDNLDLQLFCTSCGHHFHSYCVDMHIPITPVVRMGWQCSYCKLCQGCKQPGDEDRMLCCDNCDKGFHTYCLNPPITSVPKSAWKCISCRKCEDCGSTRPGGGPSCKWHNNFSLCDRCYQQRKKGQCCPVCNRAVRLCSSSILMQCSQCFKCVHRDCDPDGIEDNYICVECVKNENHAMMEDVEMEDMMNNETNDSYDYDLLASGQKKLTLEEAELFSMAASQDFIESCQANNNNSPHLQINLPQDDLEQFESEKYSESTVDSPYSSVMSESLAEPSNSNFFPMVNRKGPTKSRRLHKPGRGKKRNRNGSIESVTQFEKEKPIVIQIDELPDSTSNLTASSSTKEAPESISILSEEGEEEDEDDFEETEEDNEDGLHSTVLIVSNKDEFTLKQDVCMCCGSFGKGREGYLIGCVQCGQCFHPYCVNVKVNEVILSRGWRCIDCTVCEGCGLNADEAHLLLCDICDVSFHTYCLQPPLEEVPVGGWKCQWCAVCEDCGVKEPGYGCSWMGNYSQCGQCSSEQYCSICSYPYEPNNLVIQCEKCDRWAHAECDGLNSESDAKLACTMTYHCVHCRPKTKHLGIYSSLKSSVITKVSIRKALNSNDKNEKPKKTKTLKDVKLDKMAKAALREQKRAAEDALPLVPQNAVRDDSGVVDIDLNMMRSKLRCDDTLKERLHLTENGLKQIKSLVIRAPHIRSTRARRRKEEKNLFVATLTEESNQASIADESNQAIIENQDEQSVDKPDMPSAPPSETLPEPIEGSQDLLDGAIPSSEPLLGTAEPDIMSPEQVKQEDDMEMIAPDTTAETDELLLDDYDIDPEDATDPFEFFGVNLLERHLHLELEYIQEGKKKRPKKEKKEKRRKRDAKLMASFFTGPSVPDPTDLSLSLPPAPPEEPVVPSSEPPMQLEDGQEPLPMDPNQSADSEILQEPGTEEVMLPTESPAPESALMDTDIPMETDSFDVEMPVQGQSSMEVDFHDSAPQSVDMSTVNTQLPTGGEGLNPITSTDITPSSLNVSTPDSHLISTSVIPTSSLSVDVSQPSVDLLAKQHPLEIKVDNSPTITSKMITPPIDMISSAEHLPHVDGHEMAQYLAGIELETALPPGAPTSVPGSIPGGNPLDMFPPTQQQRPMGGPHSHHHLLQAAFDPIHTHPQQQLMQMKSPPIMSPTGMDPFKLGPFAEESRAGGQQSAPIDAQTQKQLKKWEADEKMGENATISPVLYANMIHREELDTNYRDWPARGRAIAKLWRKLPTEQREPYRIKARENRVKLKETKKKKTTTKKSTKEPTATATNISQEQPTPQQIHPTTSFATNSNDQPLPTSTSSTNLQFNPQQMMVNPHLTQPQRQQPRPSDDIQSQTITTSSIDLPMPSSTSDASRGLLSPPPPPHSAPQQPHTPQHHKTPIGATVLTVPEPQQLSPLLQKISPPYAISSLSNVIRSPTSPFVPGVGGTQSPYPPNTPSTPHTPATPVSDSPSNKSDAAPGSGNKEKKKRPKLTKQEREANKLAREQKKKMAEKKQQEQQQWKILQQQRIFEQERQAILNQSKTMVGVSADPMHPSQRFNATMNSSLAEDALQHSLMLKAKAASNPETIQPSTSLPASTPNSSMDPTPTSGIARPASAFSSGQIATTTTVMSSIPSNVPHRPTTSSLHPNEPYPPQHHGMSRNEFLKGMHGNNLPDTFASYEHLDPMRMRSAEQQKAYLFQQQQQQYMASQQQYIQWQLAQQAAGNAYGQDHAKANATDGKDLTGLESEEQERLIRMMYEQRQNEKRPGDHPPGQSYPPFPPDSRASGHGGYPPSRMGQFPGANSPEAAIYQQMFMEYFMRYRKSQGHLDSSGGQFPPSHEIYLMAELAKQSFIRQQYAAKGYGMGQQQPCHPKPQEPFKHSTGYRGGVPPEQYDWNRMHQGGGPLPHQDAMMPPAHPHGAPTSVVKPPNVPANPLAQKPPPAPSKPSSNMQGTLPKSASFQISRIAADSTSNDDFPNTTDDSAKQNEQDITKKTENKAMTDENEISSSKSSRGFSESTDTEETSTISTKNDEPVDQTKESASSGHAETEADERVTTPTDKKKLSTYEELNDNEDIFPVTRTRFLSRPRRCFDDEEEILGRGCFHSRYSDSDNESFTELPSLVDDDEDRCFLDNQPMCTMGLENDDAPTDSNERLPSASSMDENSNSTTVPSRPESCSDQQFTTQDRIPSSGSMEAPRVPRDPTSHFSPLGNVPDSAYMNNLLSRSASQGMSQHHSSYYQQQSSMFVPPSSMPSYPASSSVHGSPMFINSHNPELPQRPGHYSAFPRDQMPIGGRSTAPLSDFLPKQSAINTPMEPWKCVFPLPVSTPNPYPPSSTPQQVTDQKPKVTKKQQKTPEKRPHSRTPDLKTPPAREGTPVQTSANQPPNSSIPTSSPSLLTTAIKSEPSNHNASHSITKTNQSPTAKTLSSAISSTLTATAGLPTSQPSTGSDSKLISVHPGTPQYHQIFVYQHQLLIMQFQQYQFQLQAQFQQLSLQQMSSQQLHVLQQQFQQQMMLLQQQFNQQQAQLHRMAATGIQFTESQLNAMYQQQVITQQAYQQWIHALSPRQRMHLQQQMQARMREVQHQMAQIVHQTSRNEVKLFVLFQLIA